MEVRVITLVPCDFSEVQSWFPICNGSDNLIRANSAQHVAKSALGEHRYERDTLALAVGGDIADAIARAKGIASVSSVAVRAYMDAGETPELCSLVGLARDATIDIPMDSESSVTWHSPYRIGTLLADFERAACDGQLRVEYLPLREYARLIGSLRDAHSRRAGLLVVDSPEHGLT